PRRSPHQFFRVGLAGGGLALPRAPTPPPREGVFYAELVFASGVEVSARPSDAIALALRTGTPIFGTDGVLDDAGIAIPDEQEDEVEKFREFLDQISPEDFGTNSQ
ncbi:bifunctional nuclease family protein, partial [Streptomyces inhibens]|uniref:bifunctional nuclease family protein n=1 Tax=Streptomyces inhibens TaxID=2293571 RepID=UPI003687AD66